MFSIPQRGTFSVNGRPGIKVHTQYNYVVADPVGWTSDEVIKYIARHSRAFDNPDRLSDIVVLHKLTGRYFVEMDREGLQRAANIMFNGNLKPDLPKDFEKLWDLLQGKAKRTSPVVQPRSPVWNIFSPESPL